MSCCTPWTGITNLQYCKYWVPICTVICIILHHIIQYPGYWSLFTGPCPPADILSLLFPAYHNYHLLHLLHYYYMIISQHLLHTSWLSWEHFCPGLLENTEHTSHHVWICWKPSRPAFYCTTKGDTGYLKLNNLLILNDCSSRLIFNLKSHSLNSAYMDEKNMKKNHLCVRNTAGGIDEGNHKKR